MAHRANPPRGHGKSPDFVLADELIPGLFHRSPDRAAVRLVVRLDGHQSSVDVDSHLAHTRNSCYLRAHRIRAVAARHPTNGVDILLHVGMVTPNGTADARAGAATAPELPRSRPDRAGAVL